MEIANHTNPSTSHRTDNKQHEDVTVAPDVDGTNDSESDYESDSEVIACINSNDNNDSDSDDDNNGNNTGGNLFIIDFG